MFVNTVGNNFVNLNKAEQGDDLKDHFLLSTDSLKNQKNLHLSALVHLLWITWALHTHPAAFAYICLLY